MAWKASIRTITGFYREYFLRRQPKNYLYYYYYSLNTLLVPVVRTFFKVTVYYVRGIYQIFVYRIQLVPFIRASKSIIYGFQRFDRWIGNIFNLIFRIYALVLKVFSIFATRLNRTFSRARKYSIRPSMSKFFQIRERVFFKIQTITHVRMYILYIV